MKTYDHAFTLAFSMGGSTDPDGHDVTAEQMKAALIARIDGLVENDEMLEAAGAPFETYEE